MKKGLVHVIFVVDESGSMYGSVADVIGGYKKTIEEQKAVKDGECIVSMYKFSSTVEEVYLGKKVEDVGDLDYSPGGMTKLYDGIGTAVDNVGKWLNKMDEDEKPSKNLVVIITDGEENYSTEYSLDKIREMIKHQEDKYDWSFVYLGNDLSDAKDANNLGLKYKGFTTKKKFYNNYDWISTGATLYRCAATLDEANDAFASYATNALSMMNDEYEKDTGIKVTTATTSYVDTENSAINASIDASDKYKRNFDDAKI